jgi:hypothetical protein
LVTIWTMNYGVNASVFYFIQQYEVVRRTAGHFPITDVTLVYSAE